MNVNCLVAQFDSRTINSSNCDFCIRFSYLVIQSQLISMAQYFYLSYLRQTRVFWCSVCVTLKTDKYERQIFLLPYFPILTYFSHQMFIDFEVSSFVIVMFLHSPTLSPSTSLFNCIWEKPNKSICSNFFSLLRNTLLDEKCLRGIFSAHYISRK